jgi:chromosome partitioning protein
MSNREFTNYDLKHIEELSESSTNVLDAVRTKLLEPEPRKLAPSFSSNSLATLLNLDKRRINQLAAKEGNNLPEGEIPKGSNARHFTLAETLEYVEKLNPRPKRPKGERGRIICTTVFKGGTGKTTSSFCIAQGLTLRGARKVLLLDADPQGTLTQLAGFAPDVDIDEEATVMPYIYGDQKDLRYAIKKTYWKNLDLIPANISLYAADFYLPAKYSKDKSYKFWQAMHDGLMDLAQDYDAIIIDCPPSLNYLTFNMIFSADGIIMPIPPNSVDFASSTQFWRLVHHMFQSLIEVDKDILNKKYDFISVVPSRVKSKEMSSLITGWMAKAFGEHLTPISIPESTAVDNFSFGLMTVYDQTKAIGSNTAFRKYKDKMDELVDHVDLQLIRAWGMDWELENE